MTDFEFLITSCINLSGSKEIFGWRCHINVRSKNKQKPYDKLGDRESAIKEWLKGLAVIWF